MLGCQPWVLEKDEWVLWCNKLVWTWQLKTVSVPFLLFLWVRTVEWLLCSGTHEAESKVRWTGDGEEFVSKLLEVIDRIHLLTSLGVRFSFWGLLAVSPGLLFLWGHHLTGRLLSKVSEIHGGGVLLYRLCCQHLEKLFYFRGLW